MTADASADPLIGALIGGRYRILTKLGEGAMGAVYVAEHVKIGRHDAIKLLRTSLARDQEAIARFSRGARIVSAVRHPNVCAIYDFSETEDGYQFLAMEYVPGETLKETLDREGRLPTARAIHIARQVAAALQAAHDAGIIHRDLKPGNIMLVTGRDGQDQIKVVDFDIAKGPEVSGEEVTRHGFVVGTPEYMSPEQLMGEPLDGRSDVYSLGLVLFRMLTGTLPFRGESPQDLMVQRLTTPPLTLHEVLPGAPFPEALQPILDSTLQRNASQRCASAAQLEQWLATWAAAGEAASPAAAASLSPAPPVTSPAPPLAEASELPRTRVAPAVPPQHGVTPAAATRSRRLVPLVAAGVAVLAVAAAAAATLLRGDAAPVDAAADTLTAPVPAAPAAAVDSQQPPAAQVPDPPVRQPTGGAVDRAPPGDERATPDPVLPAVPVINPQRANSVLYQQLFRLDPDARPPASAIQAAIDTAAAVWRMPDASSTDRALAAYIIGSAYDLRREWRQCVQWVDSALAVNPEGRGFADLRSKCQGLGG